MPDIIRNEAKHRFETTVDGLVSVLDYRVTPGEIAFTHAGVPKPMEGRGIASSLTKAGLDYARNEDLAVVPLCPFVVAYLRRHQEYLDIVHPGFRDQVRR